MIDFNGFDKGVIGKKLPSDTTLNNMRKADLIELLHIADHNHEVLAEVYKIAVDNSKCNTCPLGQKREDHDQQIRNEERERVIKKLKLRRDCVFQYTDSSLRIVRSNAWDKIDLINSIIEIVKGGAENE